MVEKNNKLRVVTGKVRLCFPYLFTPRPAQEDGQEDKYSVMLLVPKEDTATMKALRAAEKEALAIGKNTKFGGKTSGLAPSIIRDADEDGSAEDYPEREGCYYLSVNATLKFPPEIVDARVQPIIQQSEVYSGVYARVSISAFAYNSSKKKGVSFGLNNVQILGGGEQLGGGLRAASEFDEFEDEDEDALL